EVDGRVNNNDTGPGRMHDIEQEERGEDESREARDVQRGGERQTAQPQQQEDARGGAGAGDDQGRELGGGEHASPRRGENGTPSRVRLGRPGARPSGGRCEEASGGRIAQRDRTGPPHDDETVLSKSHAVPFDRSATGATKQQGGRCSDRRPLRPVKGGGGEGIWRRRDGPA